MRPVFMVTRLIMKIIETAFLLSAAPTAEPIKPELAPRASNQLRSRSQEPENDHSDSLHHHHRRSHTVSETPALQETPCPRPRVHDSVHHGHALRSPKTQTSCGRPSKRVPAAPPTTAANVTPHQSSAPYRRHKQRPRESHKTGPLARAAVPLVTSGPVPEKEQVKELPGVVLYESGLGQVVQRHEHHHHHEHHYHYHHFYQS